MRKFLSEVLKVVDITQSSDRKFCIVSGVGSGKNYFVENELKGAGNILYVSSRRAKVNEILINKACNEKINWRKDVDDIVSTTYYGIELLVKNDRFSTSGLQNVMEHFDFIVLDEAHALYTDATYTESSFHVECFLRYVEEHHKRIKIILMTGTPEPLMEYFEKHEYKILDFRDVCINVMPKAIKVISQEAAINFIRQMPKEEKTIYYSNSASRLVSGKKPLYKVISQKEEFDESTCEESDIAFCMSESSIKRLKPHKPDLQEECEKFKKYVTENNKLPEDKRVLLTTSTLKEGVNIRGTDIKIAFCESHILSDIQQFAGRVREGLETLYLIDDANQFILPAEKIKLAQMETMLDITGGLLEQIDGFYKKLVMNPESPIYNFIQYDNMPLKLYDAYGMSGDFSPYRTAGEACKAYIDFIHANHKYIRFNHLANAFEMYVARFREEYRLYTHFHGNLWETRLKDFAETNHLEYVPPIRTAKEKIDKENLLCYIESVVGEEFVNEDGANELVDTLRQMLMLGDNCKTSTINKKIESMRINYKIKDKPIRKDGKSARAKVIVKTE